MAAALAKFLSDLNVTPAPPEFAADDAVFRHQIPKAIADLKAMVACAQAGDKATTTHYAGAYVLDMKPAVTDAMDHVDPSVVHS